MKANTISRMSVRMRIVVLACLVILLAAKARTGPAGRVVDSEGAPIVGGKACLVIAGVEGLCDATDVEGRYALPASDDAVSVRLSARGYLPINVAAVVQESAVVLEQAASLLVRVVDAQSGEGIDSSEVLLIYSTGHQFGPLPANRAGLSLATLPPGDVRIVATSDGYRESAGTPVQLVRGAATPEIVVKLSRTLVPAAK